MDKISKLVDEAEKLTQNQVLYNNRVKTFRKWVWDIAIAERKEVMQMQDLIPT
jgi:hypothetical protein